MEIISSLDNKYDFGYVNSEIDIKIQKRNGSITLFLSLIILIVISLVLTSVENARISSAYTRENEISYMALDSCFSSYAKEVFDEYPVHYCILFGSYAKGKALHRQGFSLCDVFDVEY